MESEYKIITMDDKLGVKISHEDLLVFLKFTYKRNKGVFNRLSSNLKYLNNNDFDIDNFIKQWEKNKKSKRGIL